MPGWLKVLIILAILGILLVVGILAAGAFWWSRNKDALIGKAKAEVTEGREAGRKTDNQGCVDQSVLRYKEDPGFTSFLATNIFMPSCLQASRPTPGFCDDVPKRSEFTRTARWRVTQCERFDLSGDKYCDQLFSPIQNFCEGHTWKPNSEQTDSP